MAGMFKTNCLHKNLVGIELNLFWAVIVTIFDMKNDNTRCIITGAVDRANGGLYKQLILKRQREMAKLH